VKLFVVSDCNVYCTLYSVSLTIKQLTNKSIEYTVNKIYPFPQ